MGCFPACLRLFSNRRHCKTEKPDGTEVLDKKTEETQIADPVKINAEIENKTKEHLNSSARKEVTFDLNVEIYAEECGTQSPESANVLAESQGGNKCGRRKNEFRAFLYSSEKEKKKEAEQGINQAKVLQDSKEQPEEEEDTSGKQGNDQAADDLSDSSQSSLFTYPLYDRYKNRAPGDDACEGDTAANKSNLVAEVVSNYKNKDSQDGRAGPMIQEESSESLFSLSIDSRKQSSAPEIGDKEVSSPFKPCNRDRDMKSKNARDRTEYVDSVLNPIENVSQRKAVSTKTTSLLKNQKENVNYSEEFTGFFGRENLSLETEFSEEPTLTESKKFSSCRKDDVIAIDTSLSSWLNDYQKTPIKDNSPDSVGNSSSKTMKSPKSFEDRPILGALTLDELKLMSRHSSPRGPRRSPSFSPDETPIIGTVGSYWRHTGQSAAADSGSSCKRTSSESSISGKCRKGKIRSYSSPFQTRLEKAMDSVAAEV